MTTEKAEAAGTREGREECLEALFRLESAAQKVTWDSLKANPDLEGIDIPATLLSLVERNEIEITDGEIRLRSSGRATGKRIFRRHEIAERFLHLFGLRQERAHKEACRLEHIMALPGDRISGLSEHDELSLIVSLFGKGALPLTRIHQGVGYQLELVCAGRGARRKLEEMGVSPGAEVTLCSRRQGGPVEIMVRGSRLALGRGIASKVLVIPVSEDLAAEIENEPSKTPGRHEGSHDRHQRAHGINHD